MRCALLGIFLGIFSVLVHFVDAWGPGGDLVDACAYNGSTFTDGYLLGAYCLNDQTAIFGYNYTIIDLNLCVGNDDGTLVGLENGSYSEGCSNCTTANRDQSLYLICACLDINGQQHSSSIDLNTVLYNVDGCAHCFGHAGNKSWTPPS
ncbi:hypothetical protein B0H63DRAFT_533150 [Podospora didyma]|uniref:Cyanovirin-N domain-containing protein n=1 Tax=Podospora didyma TaxID=330526 RepID=A0AAE0P7Q0_9PEZI|nr:hypothetical protein B0H63DRAFT_533150 [Podospora didyma]